jgi:fucose permease
LLPIAFIGFVILGMPRAAESVAWPSMSTDLDQRLGALGWLIAVHIAGYFVASIANGEITRRLGTGRALVTSGLLASGALIGYAVTPGWAFLLVAAFLLGVAGGMIDAAMNAYVALNHSARVMGLLHASFGLGATLSPLVMAWLITGESSNWRWGFALLAALQGAVTIAFWRTRNRWEALDGNTPERSGRPSGVLPLLAGFLLVAGLEGGSGAWAFTFLTKELAVSDGVAGLLVGAFYACFTLGRVVMGIAGDRISPAGYVAFGKIASIVGVALLWWSPTPSVAGLGLLLIGLGIAPLFPILMVITPAIVGPEHAHDVVGYELGAATVGAALVPGIIGAAVDTVGTQSIPVVLAVVTVAQALIVPSRGRNG